MRITKYNSKDFRSKQWSGGTTTELFIFPHGTSLKDLNFDFRISKATIEVDNSTFTPLPGVKRTFTLLAGNTMLRHQGHHTAEISANEVDQFLGEWTTNSAGKCTPFNLMTMNNCAGDIRHLYLEENQEIELQYSCDFVFIYCNKGKGIVLNEEQTELASNEIIILSELSSDTITFQSCSDSHIVIVYIELNKKKK